MANGKRDTDPPMSKVYQALSVAAYLDGGLKGEAFEYAVEAARSRPQGAYNCCMAIIRSHGIVMAPETRQ